MINFSLIWPFFTPMWEWFIPLKFFYQMEKILFFISHYEETFPFGFFEKYYTLLYETLKSTLDTPIFRGELHRLRACETLWSAKEIAPVALSAEQERLLISINTDQWERHTENVFHIVIRTCEIPRSVSKTVNNFFHYGLHLRPKKATWTAEMISVPCVAIFWVVNASSDEKLFTVFDTDWVRGR